MFRIRQVRAADLPALWPLAKRLDSYNLPADRRTLAHLVDVSMDSFRGHVPKSRAKYLFVLEQCSFRIPHSAFRHSRIIGCSLILAKHGTRSLPHLWMDVKTVRKTSRTLRRTVTHRLLQLGVTTDGPTEVGGLIVLPAFRGNPERLGRQLSYVRFLYMALHPERFEQEVLAEYLPPLTPRGDSLLWRAFGQRLTGLPYYTADRWSATTKEFILKLFPREPVYATFFSPEVQAQIGRVHPSAAGACALLRRIGFRYSRQVEPFDGGPYFGAPRRRITLIRHTRLGTLTVARHPPLQRCLIGHEPRVGEFRAVWAAARWRGGQWELTADALAALEASVGGQGVGAPVAR